MQDAVDAFFATFPPEIHATSRILREMVCKSTPGAYEVLYAHHNNVGYGLTQSYADRIVYICLLKDYVRLGFFYGGTLSDPMRILVGTGKRLRHVKVYNAQEARNPALERLVEAAWADAASHLRKNRPWYSAP